MNMSSSVRIKLGPVEFECTASEDFLKVELPVLIAGMTQLYKENFADLKTPAGAPLTSGNGAGSATTNQIELTTNSIAAKLKAKTGSDLVLAAALRLTRMGKVSFTRAELTAQMREAPAYFKQTYINNLSTYIKPLLTGGKLLENAKDTFALSDAAKMELEGRLAQP